MRASGRTIEDIRLRMMRVGLLAAEGAATPAVGLWARKAAAAARRRCARRGCVGADPRELAIEVAHAARRDIAYVDEWPEVLTRADVLLEAGAGDCDDTAGLVLAALLRLGIPAESLAVWAGLDRRGPMWHIWPAYRGSGEWVHLDASTDLTEPGGRSPVEVAGLEEVIQYPLPAPAQMAASGRLRAAGVATARAGWWQAALAIAEETGAREAADDAVDDLMDEVRAWTASLFQPKTVRYREERTRLRRLMREWIDNARYLADAMAVAPAAHRAQLYEGANALLDRAEALTHHPEYIERFGDAHSVPPSPGAIQSPDGGWSPLDQLAEVEQARDYVLQAAVRESGLLEATVADVLPPEGWRPPTQQPPAYQGAAPGAPADGGGGLDLGLLALAIPAVLAFAGGPVALATAGALVMRRANQLTVPDPGRSLVPGLGWTVIEEAVGGDEPAPYQGVPQAVKEQLAYLALFPLDRPPGVVPDPEAVRTARRLQGYADLGLITLGELATLLSLQDRLPQTLRDLAGLNLTPEGDYGRAVELEWAGVAGRSWIERIQSRVAEWAAESGLADSPEDVVQEQLEDMAQPVAPETEAVLVEAARRKPGFGSGVGAGVILGILGAIVLVFLSR